MLHIRFAFHGNGVCIYSALPGHSSGSAFLAVSVPYDRVVRANNTAYFIIVAARYVSGIIGVLHDGVRAASLINSHNSPHRKSAALYRPRIVNILDNAAVVVANDTADRMPRTADAPVIPRIFNGRTVPQIVSCNPADCG